ncbi:uncharacterized protein LOC113340728 [Papaver somniferum]|uniref:uncharacterized protein LOC113340728 n=1 Tax=Papaver somniferum TaxID=3469 RepID=UPI000E6F4961|nr:uncharacterized protein LOC113340728 [Papaver somniferum]
MRCSNHVLHLIVLCGMKVVVPFIDAIRECVKYFRSSQARKERFTNAMAKVKLAGRSGNKEYIYVNFWNYLMPFLPNLEATSIPQQICIIMGCKRLINALRNGKIYSEHDYIRDMGLNMRGKFDSYWKESNMLMGI